MGGMLIKVLTPGLYTLHHLHQNLRLHTCVLHDPWFPVQTKARESLRTHSERSHVLGSLPSHPKAGNAALVLVTPQDILLGRMMEFSAVL